MEYISLPHNLAEWRLFIDSSKLSLQAVLLDNCNIYPSISVGYAVHTKETYENMKALLKSVKYAQYKWQICGDFKVVALLLGMQLGYTKQCCFLCMWDCRDRKPHYKKVEWSARNLKPGEKMFRMSLWLILKSYLYLSDTLNRD